VGMYSSVRMHRGPFLPALSLVIAALVAGCGKQEEITSYTVAKEAARPEPPISAGSESPASAETEPAATTDPSTGPDRMLGAIVLRPQQGWFFKLTGPEAAVTAAREPFVNFLKTVDFTGPDQSPVWKLPEGWTEGAPRAMRFATLAFKIDDVPLELAISSLPNQGGDADSYLLMNLNRWRGQLGLGPSTLDSMRSAEGELETIELTGSEQALVTNLRGKLSTGGMSAPFAR